MDELDSNTTCNKRILMCTLFYLYANRFYRFWTPLPNMAPSVIHIRRTCRRFKAHILMAMVQIGYTILYFITEASFNRGLNPHVYVTYRHLVSALVMWPFAYFLERYKEIFFNSYIVLFLTSFFRCIDVGDQDPSLHWHCSWSYVCFPY